MNTGSIGPTMVVAIPLKMKPTKSTASKPVRLPLVRSGISTVVVVDMCAKHSEGASRQRQLSVEVETATSRGKIRVGSSSNLESCSF